MNILITGSDGAVGNEIAKNLQKNKYNKLILHTKFKKKNKKNINYFYCKDLSKKIKLSITPKVIIHCAGVNKINKKKIKKKIFDKNVEITNSIINYANKNNVKKIFFLSSIDAYGLIKKKNISEKDKSFKVNAYGRSKIICEKNLCNKENVFKSICFRVPGILTYNLKRDRPLLINIIKKIYLKKKLLIFNPKSNFNNVLDVYEICRVIKILLNKRIGKSDIYNLSAISPIKFQSIIQIISKKLKLKTKIYIEKSSKKSFIINNKKIIKKFKIKISSTNDIISRFCDGLTY
jgi:nucleoside-diphosphate-sugar epimerase